MSTNPRHLPRTRYRLFPLPIIYTIEGGKQEAWEAGFNARNRVFRIEIFRGLPNFAGILSQELYEIHFKWRWLIFPAFLFNALKRRMELMSHAIEIQIAVRFYGYTESDYEAIEIPSMRRYDYLYDWTEPQILAAVRRNYRAANRWIDDHHEFIQKAYDRGNE